MAEEQRFCGSCGAPALPESEQPTRTSYGQPRSPAPDLRPSSTPSQVTSDHGRFVPGTVLDERYRVLGLLGRGGMGEVYHADDLKLGQQVALKFLPEEFERDATRLQRFLNEVKTARQVTHPNVCRVYDVGEVEGRHFLSMEYVDGEDLASLLRRIGRLSPDKAIQIARQTCVGLAAAHEKGILHRDLKPANIMLDGRGQVRLTDFGLAGLVDEFEGHELRAGTPAYMAPEQLAGRDVSEQSDLYSLGLVLYEIFTGERAFQADTAADLAHQQESLPTMPSSLVEGLDPAVERVVLRCLEPDPGNRPATVLGVAAALPGGDPLAAALAAGETPSPEMVADAKVTGGLRPAVAVPLLAAALLLLLLAILFRPVAFLNEKAPFEVPPQELLSRAKSILQDLGYDELPRYESYGFHPNAPLLDYIQESDLAPGRWESLATGRPPGILFWARFSPQPLLTAEFHYPNVTPSNPPQEDPGSLTIRLDSVGRLVSLQALPPQTPSRPAHDTDWSSVFDSAGLDVREFSSAEIVKNPRVPALALQAWTGPFPWTAESQAATIQAGAVDGRITYFEILGPHNRPGASSSEEYAGASDSEQHGGVFGVVTGLLMAIIIGGAVFLARRNLASGRGDRSGATRLAIFLFVTILLTWLLLGVRLGGFRFGDLVTEVVNGSFMGHALFHVVLVWFFYVALEPYVRRIWPNTLVSWTRVLRGRFRDPMVGRDILIGALLAGISWSLLPWAELWIGNRILQEPWAPEAAGLASNLSWELVDWIGITTWAISDGLTAPMAILTFIVIMRVVLGTNRRAVAATAVIVTAMTVLASLTAVTDPPGIWILWLILRAILLWFMRIFVLLRFGLMPAILASFFSGFLEEALYTLDLSDWWAAGSLLHISLLAGFFLYGFFVSLGGRKLFSDPLAE